MTITELIKELQTVDGDRIVVMASDGEGNNFSPLCGCGTAAYKADSLCSGEIGLEELTDKARDGGFSEDDVLDGVPAVVFWPIT